MSNNDTSIVITAIHNNRMHCCSCCSSRLCGSSF